MKRMKKPYIKKIGDFSDHKVFYVNGYWIRKNLDKEFTNFGSRRHFDFIPNKELWIDQENGDSEVKYFVQSFLTIEREIEKGKTYEQAVKTADRIEKRERMKTKEMKILKKLKIKSAILRRIHYKKLFSKYTDKIHIWVVKGDLVRSLFFLDFTEGGHDLCYHFVPKNEIWIDDDIYKKEIPYILIHELHERKLMLKGWPYAPGGVGNFSRKGDAKGKSAHFHSADLELWCRHHPRSVKKILLKEIKDNENLSEVKKKNQK